MRRLGLVTLLSSLAAGCGGGDGNAVLDMFGPSLAGLEPGSAIVQGEFDGETIGASHAISSEYAYDSENSEGVVILSEIDLCGPFEDGYIPFGTKLILVEIFEGDTASIQAPQSSGEFPVQDPYVGGSGQYQSYVSYGRLSTTECSLDNIVRTESGIVTLDDVAQRYFAGEGNAVTEWSEDVTFAFRPTICTAIDDYMNGNLPCG